MPNLQEGLSLNRTMTLFSVHVLYRESLWGLGDFSRKQITAQLAKGTSTIQFQCTFEYPQSIRLYLL